MKVYHRFSVKELGKDRMRFLLFLILLLSGVVRVHAQDKLKNIPDPSPEYELSTLVPAEGYEVNLFASDPMIEKPIQMNWDEKGRLWVVGSDQYPHPKPGALPTGKIYVLEDTNGDGQADKVTVFADGLSVPTAVLPGDGGAYVANATELLHLKDTDGDGVADQRKVILTGFGTGDTHHLIHTFRWGPDGSLYFNQSIYIYSHVETPWGIRRLEGGGVWRYRPSSGQLDVFVHGLVNPWGLRFNRYGQSFLTDGAGIEGINYGFQGATFVTAPGAERIIVGLNPGQPKHSGLDIVTGRHLPESWAGSLVTNDFRANRINRFSLERLGSGYISRQEEDILYSDNVAFRPVDITVGPDGALYVADWYNPIIQHGEVDFRDPRRDHVSGRIWRIVRKDSPLVAIPDLTRARNQELLEFLKLPEAWTRDQARRLLKERGAASVLKDLGEWTVNLDPNSPEYEEILLEAFWIYQSLDKAEDQILEKLLNASDPLVRAAAVRGLYYQYELYPDADEYLRKAVKDQDPTVRLEAVISLRKSGDKSAATVATEVLEQDMDIYIDFALWQTLREGSSVWLKEYDAHPDYFGSERRKAFALKSVSDPRAISALADMYLSGELPEDYQDEFFSMAGRYATPKDLNPFFQRILKKDKNSEKYLDLLIEAATKRGVKPDQDLSGISALLGDENSVLAQKTVDLAGLWGLEEFRLRFVEWAKSGDEEKRKTGLTALVNLGDEKSYRVITDLTKEGSPTELRVAATRHLISIDPEQASRSAVAILTEKNMAEKYIRELLTAFIGNQNGPRALKDALTGKKIPDLVAEIGGQELNKIPDRRLGNESLKALKEMFKGTEVTVKTPTVPDHLSKPEMDRLLMDVKTYGDPVKGELEYRKLGCEACHAVGGSGGKLGPELGSLGANAPMDYIVNSILKPSEDIKEGYELNQVIKKNGEVLMGYKVRETESEMVIRDVAGREVSVPKFQIDSHQHISGSLMPPGTASSLTREEFVDLIAFLTEIGKPGDFRLPKNNYVRYWEALSRDEKVSDWLTDNRLENIGENSEKFDWNPVYSLVSGTLPLREVERVGGVEKAKIIRFRVEVLSAGKIRILFDPSDIEAWVDGKKVRLTKEGIQADLGQGIHEVILALKPGRDQNEFKAEIPEGTSSGGRARPFLSALP